MKFPWIVFFIGVLIGDLLAVQFGSEVLESVFKPLLTITLGAYFAVSLRDKKDPLKKWIIAALFFSWAGDVLLLFDSRQTNFFLLGLSAFLIAHIFYIIFFHRVRMAERPATKLRILVFVVLYYILLVSFLSPHLGDMRLPVRIYGLVISFMLLLAMHMFFINDKTAGKWMMFGALLFVISDSILAIDKFYNRFEFAGILIMLTYGLAQLFITQGAIQYIRKKLG